MRQICSWLTLVFALTTWTVSALSAGLYHDRAAGYQYPYDNPYLASATIRLVRPTTSGFISFTIESLPGREAVAILGKTARLEVTMFKQDGPAPLVFIVPGYGGGNTEGAPLFLAESLHRQGMNAVVLPNPSNWKFIVSQAAVAIPGSVPDEAADLYRVMQNVVEKVRSEYGVQPTSFGLLGYSAGGTYAAYVRQLDKRQRQLNFKRVLLINPPLDISYAIQRLDALYAAGASWSPAYRDRVWGYVMSQAMEVMAQASRGERVIDRLDQYVKVTQQELEFIIGDSYRESLNNAIFASQQVLDIGLLKTPATEYRRTARMAEAHKFSFTSYLENAAFPYWAQRLPNVESAKDLVGVGNLLPIARQLAADPAIYMMHNRDDFTVRATDVEKLARTLGDRAFLYPRGGHMGNLWCPFNREDIATVFSGLN